MERRQQATPTDRRLGWINARIDEGRTVYLKMAHCVTAITPEIRDRLEENGCPAVKATDGMLWVLRGGRYVVADGCAISATTQCAPRSLWRRGES